MCIECKYFRNGACEFLLTPDTCDQFDLGDKFEDNKSVLPGPQLVGSANKILPGHHE